MAIKKLCALICIGVTLISSRACYCDDKLNISVTHPWLALLATFIGGPEVNVTALRIWNSNGVLIMNDRGKTLRQLESGAKIIALDENDASASGIKDANNFTIKYLYSPFPVDVALLSDPSIVPFVAQRVLTSLSEWDPQNYPYYQRRLAEFQARLSGSVLVGQVLKDVTVCNLGDSCGILLQAAGCKILRPEEQLERWKKGNFSGLRDYLDGMKAQGVVTIYDDDTPNALKRYLSGRSDSFKWERPTLERDYPSFLHEQYISLWQKIIAKPLPGHKR